MRAADRLSCSKPLLCPITIAQPLTDWSTACLQKKKDSVNCSCGRKQMWMPKKKKTQKNSIIFHKRCSGSVLALPDISWNTKGRSSAGTLNNLAFLSTWQQMNYVPGVFCYRTGGGVLHITCKTFFFFFSFQTDIILVHRGDFMFSLQ